MAIKMKALKSFGINGANEGPVRRGQEFNCKEESRAKELEANGLAFKMQPEAKNKMEPTPVENKAASAGPLASPGGETGEAKEPASSSQAAQPRGGRTFKLPGKQGRSS